MGDGIILFGITMAIILASRYVWINGVDACSGDCNGACRNHCKWVKDMTRAKKHIRRIQKIKSFFHMA